MDFANKVFTKFREDATEALKQVAEKYKVQIKLGNISSKSDEFNITMNVIKDEEGQDIGSKKFKENCKKYGFVPEHYKKVFCINEEKYQLLGFNAFEPINKCYIKRLSDDKSFLCSCDTIWNALNISCTN